MTVLNRELLINKYGIEKLKELTEIDLRNTGIAKIDPNTFKGLEKLEKLLLNDNEIEEIGAKLFEGLKNLKELWLHRNKLKRIDSTSFNSLTELKELYIYENQIEEIDVKLFEGLKDLKELWINNNRLKQIDRNTFNGLDKLETLKLNDNDIEEIDVRLFESLSNLRYLWLYNNKLTRIDSTLFNSLTELEKLYIYDNEIEEIGVGLFKNLSNLKVLWMNNNRLKKVDRKCFESLKSIEVLQIYENDSNLKAVSFLKESTECAYEKEQLEKYGFLSVWNDFLQQFPELELQFRAVKSEDISNLSIKSDSKDLIGKVVDKKYKIEKRLGEGGFGFVYKIIDLKQNNNKVIKIMIKYYDNWEKEPIMLSQLNHKNIMKYVDHFLLITNESFCHPCIIAEYCQNGDLKVEIKKMERVTNGRFEDKKIMNWIFQVTDGVRYLHSKTIIHRDIKPQNILLTEDNIVKLADLGIAKLMKESIMTNTGIGTLYYTSPEQSNGDEYSFPTDIWSLGCVLYELVFLKLAWENRGKEHPNGGHSIFSPYIKRMLVKEPDDRIKVEKLYEDLKKQKELLDM